jgi:hypothetical protein
MKARKKRARHGNPAHRNRSRPCPNPDSAALTTLIAILNGTPRARKLALGYKYFTATRFYRPRRQGSGSPA